MSGGQRAPGVTGAITPSCTGRNTPGAYAEIARSIVPGAPLARRRSCPRNAAAKASSAAATCARDASGAWSGVAARSARLTGTPTTSARATRPAARGSEPRDVDRILETRVDRRTRECKYPRRVRPSAGRRDAQGRARLSVHPALAAGTARLSFERSGRALHGAPVEAPALAGNRTTIAGRTGESRKDRLQPISNRIQSNVFVVPATRDRPRGQDTHHDDAASAPRINRGPPESPSHAPLAPNPPTVIVVESRATIDSTRKRRLPEVLDSVVPYPAISAGSPTKSGAAAGSPTTASGATSRRVERRRRARPDRSACRAATAASSACPRRTGSTCAGPWPNRAWRPRPRS